MISFHAEDFVSLTSLFNNIARIYPCFEENQKISSQQNQAISVCLKGLRKHCAKLGFELAVNQIDRILEAIKELKPKTKIDNRKFAFMFQELINRINDELITLNFYALTKSKANYYNTKHPFGKQVANSFPSACFDIEESGKCFATARYTACVMHLQRALEIGLKAYGNSLGIMTLITSPQPSWNTVLDKTRKEIKERNDALIKNKVWASVAQKDFCENIQPFLEAVKIAWRNPSMHADKIYNEEIVEDIFGTVKRFVRHLSEHLDEAGNFTAQFNYFTRAFRSVLR